MPRASKTKDGVIVKVWLQPKSAKNEVKGFKGDALRVRVTSPPVENQANKACMEFLAKELGIGKSQVEIVAGHKSRIKIVRVTGITRDEIEKKIVKKKN